jgi:hypothetical protein
MASEQPPGERADADALAAVVDDLLVQDAERHERALDALARVGDERVLPHLVDVAALDAVAGDWSEFGFPETHRDHAPPAAFDHPECAFPGVLDALRAIGDPDYEDPGVAWLQWESWVTATDPDPLPGYVEWKVRFFRTYLPSVGHLLDAEPRHPDFDRVRWGSTTPTLLHPLNFPDWTGAGDESSDGSDAEPLDHVEDDDVVFGFTVDDAAYAVPRYRLFPHELANLDVDGTPLALTYCTMCNSPILYDRRVDGADDDPRQFGSTGCLWHGNKLMYDEETLTLWNQQTGRPVAGPGYARDRYGERRRGRDGVVSLEHRPVTQTTWQEWRDAHPETRVLADETGYDLDYERYRDYDGFIQRHYWAESDVTHPGVRPRDAADGTAELDDREYVYGVEASDGLHAFPVSVVRDSWPVASQTDDGPLVAVALDGDVAVYDAPPGPHERVAAVDLEGYDADDIADAGTGGDDSADRDTDAGVLVDADERAWRPTQDALVPLDDPTADVVGGDALERRPGRHGLWLAFRPHYDVVHVPATQDRGETTSDDAESAGDDAESAGDVDGEPSDDEDPDSKPLEDVDSEVAR